MRVAACEWSIVDQLVSKWLHNAASDSSKVFVATWFYQWLYNNAVLFVSAQVLGLGLLAAYLS